MEQSGISTRVHNFVEKVISQWPDVFAVESHVSIGKNKVTVLLDADKGINIDRCAVVNKALVKWIDEEKLFGGANYTTEVSSPGIDRPLTLLRQFRKNFGRKVSVLLNDGTKQEGELTDADENKISLQAAQKQNNKKTETKTITILFSEIKQVKVLVTF